MAVEFESGAALLLGSVRYGVLALLQNHFSVSGKCLESLVPNK